MLQGFPYPMLPRASRSPLTQAHWTMDKAWAHPSEKASLEQDKTHHMPRSTCCEVPQMELCLLRADLGKGNKAPGLRGDFEIKDRRTKTFKLIFPLP